MFPAGSSAGQKRKSDFAKSAQNSTSRKRQKFIDARAIATQRADAALSASGELNIASYVKAREFEIKALEKSMTKARKSLSTRAFQQVPRHLRRRTASHNAKKVPRRLRRRAEREMKEDNTPTVTRRKRTPSRKLRLRLETAKAIKTANRNTKTVRQRKREAAADAKQTDSKKQVELSRAPRPKVNKLAEPPRATVKFKRRQIDKTWLPTHLWHTKRAHMTKPTEPLWRMAVPLSPTEKSYRPSHRASSSAGCISWDSSYMSTIACRGTEHTLGNLLAALGFDEQQLSPALRKKWRAGSRFAEGWVSERDSERRPIAPVVVLWCVQQQHQTAVPVPNENKTPEPQAMDIDDPDPAQKGTRRKPKLDRKLLIRLHPSAFHQFWIELLKVAKSQKPQVLVEDLRFEIGSIDVQGPGSTEALLGVLRTSKKVVEKADPAAEAWTSLAGLNNPGRLPLNALLCLEVDDPRLNHPPKRIKLRSETEMAQLDSILVSWPVDAKAPISRLTSHKERWQVTTTLPSQKAINRRNAAKLPGQELTPTSKDPSIPIILLASRNEASSMKNGNVQGSWTVLMPWSCVEHVWRSLMYYPLSSGGTPRFGGLRQKQQIAFEHGIPWFPGDTPGSDAGKAWERSESEKRFDEWIRRPPKHRIAWHQLNLGLGRKGEIGRGWTCDWEHLLDHNNPVEHAHHQEGVDGPPSQAGAKILTQRQRKAAKAAQAAMQKNARRRNTSSPESDEDGPCIASDPSPAVDYIQLAPGAARSILERTMQTSLPPTPALACVRVQYLDRGTPHPAARIYRLPTAMPDSAPEIQAAPPMSAASQSSGEPTPGQRPADPGSSSSPSDHVDLRTRWLALDTHRPAPKLTKQKANKHNLPAKQSAIPRESLARINVLPKNAPQEIVDKYGPDSAFGRGNGEVPKASRATGKKTDKGKQKANVHVGEGADADADADADVKSDARTNRALLEDLLTANPLHEPGFWDLHVPCPDSHDLIGFVTSGGYNLSEGRGTAIGSVWVQRVLEGWAATTNNPEKGTKLSAQQQRERHLCVVRNAGEQVGRLAIWEVC